MRARHVARALTLTSSLTPSQTDHPHAPRTHDDRQLIRQHCRPLAAPNRRGRRPRERETRARTRATPSASSQHDPHPHHAARPRWTSPPLARTWTDGRTEGQHTRSARARGAERRARQQRQQRRHNRGRTSKTGRGSQAVWYPAHTPSPFPPTLCCCCCCWSCHVSPATRAHDAHQRTLHRRRRRLARASAGNPARGPACLAAAGWPTLPMRPRSDLLLLLLMYAGEFGGNARPARLNKSGT